MSGYSLLFCNISEYLKTSFSTKIKNTCYIKCTFIIYAYTSESKNKLVEYFSKFPLLGKTSLDYEHWLKYYNLNINSNNNSIKRINSKIKNKDLL